MAAPRPPITSRDNPVCKRVRSLQRPSIRNAERAFVVEGSRAILDALMTGAKPDLLLISTDFNHEEIETHIEPIRMRRIAPALLDDIAGTVTPQGVLAIFPWPEPAPPSATPELTLIADQIRDPGNLGTLLRSAAGAGANRVLRTKGTVDPYNAKVVRAAMGAHFRLPIGWFDSGTSSGPDPGTNVVILTMDAVTPFEQIDLRGPTWIVVGSEASGPGESVRGLATATAAIPMESAMESLNAAVAGSIMLFEAARQRRSDVFLSENPRRH